MLVLIAGIFTPLFAIGIPGRAARAVVCAVDQILHVGLCTSGPAYPVSVSTKTVGYDGRVIIVDAGHSYTVTLTHMSNGTAQISLVNTGTLGVSARVGAEVELGPLGGAEAQAGGGAYVNGSTTWTFPNWATANKYWRQISSGNSAGLAVNDALQSVPIGGSLAAGLFDDITGANGAPTHRSIDGRYLTATAAGGGMQGSASAGAGAGANVGSLGADIKASISAQAGLEHINSGELKGDWQGTVRLTVDGDGSLGDALFGPHASGIGSLDGDVTVTFGPDFKPRELEVTASGDGVGGSGTGWAGTRGLRPRRHQRGRGRQVGATAKHQPRGSWRRRRGFQVRGKP